MVNKNSKSSFGAPVDQSMGDWRKTNGFGSGGVESVPTNDPTKVDPGNCFSDNMLKKYNTSLQVLDKTCFPDDTGLYQETGFYSPSEYNNTLYSQSCNPPILPYTYSQSDCKIDPSSSVGYSTGVITKNGTTTTLSPGNSKYICYPPGYPQNGYGNSSCYGSINQNNNVLNTSNLEYFDKTKNKVFSIVDRPIFTRPSPTLNLANVGNNINNIQNISPSPVFTSINNNNNNIIKNITSPPPVLYLANVGNNNNNINNIQNITSPPPTFTPINNNNINNIQNITSPPPIFTPINNNLYLRIFIIFVILFILFLIFKSV